ncbi:hypothetical protein PFISCL1PPCAC_8494, partial [Pristionchus fissidentatus]
MKMEEMEKRLNEKMTETLEQRLEILPFAEKEILTEDLICFQTENGVLFYYACCKPRKLFTNVNGDPTYADLSLLDGVFDCSFKGINGNFAFFSSVRGKMIEFFIASLENDQIIFEKINQEKTSNISLLENQPFFCVELSKAWSIYRFEEKLSEKDGEMFNISEVNHLRKFDCCVHREIMYLFRENDSAVVEKVNEKVIRVESPLIDSASYFIPQYSDFIYILNSGTNLLLILNTSNLTFSKFLYESPRDCDAHSIVGVYNGILTMRFQPLSPSRPLLMTTQLPENCWN